jgi:mannan endo-1,4-beta-mannosidase
MADTPLTRRGLLAGGAAGAAGLLAAPVLASTAAAADPRYTNDFVTVSGGGFRLHGKPFRFGGTNTYYLHQKSHYMIDNALGDAAAMGLPVIRAWAFADGTDRSEKPLQPAPYRYDEAAFDSLDYAVYRAGQLGLRLVLGLTNNWPDYGGMAQYVTWFLGLPDDSYTTEVNHDRFYDTPAIQDCFRSYVRHVLTRVNRYTHRRYTEDPTVMAWELANEPRSRSDRSGARLLTWITETSRYVQRLAPHQLVAVGDEGFYGDPTATDYPYTTYEGDRWKDFIALPSIDYATFHLYPQNWGHPTDPVPWGTRWITDHLTDARAAGKPAVLEEYGLGINPAQAIPDTAARDAGYQTWTDTVLTEGGAGDQFWLLTSRVDDGSFYPDYDGLRVYWSNDPTNPTNTTAHLLASHATAMTTAT